MAGARDWFVLVDHRVLVDQLLLDSSGEMTTLRTSACDSESITDGALVVAKVPIRGFAPVVGDAHGFPVF